MSDSGLNRRQEFQKGWRVLLACFCGVGGGIASISFYTAGIFIVPIEQEFAWSRSTIAAQGVFTVLILVIGSPFIGRLIDKIGVRRVAVFSLIAYAMSIFISSYLIVSLWTFYLMAIVTAIVALGSTPLAFTKTITSHFDAARGLALGVALMSTGFVAALAPALLTGFVDEFGWRSGYRSLAIFILSTALIVWVFIKDELKKESQSVEGRAVKQNGDGHLKAYLTDKTFIKLGTIFFLVALAVSGTIIHFIPMLLHLEINAADAGKLAAVLGVSVMIGRLATGFLIDRFHAPNVASLLFGLSSVGYLVFIFGGVNYAIFAAMAIGISMGAEVDLIGYLVSRYFGLKRYGAIYGALYAIFLVGASISPLLLAFLFDTNDSYTQALSLATGALILASLLCLTLSSFPKTNR